MAANKLEVFLGFKPNLEGLNRFASAIEQRLERVRAFNMRIENGAQATNQLLSQAAAAISGARIAQSLTGIIRRGVDFNTQVEQARLGIAAVLKQFDETGKFKNFDEAINESGRALDLLKQKAVTSPASFANLVQAFQGTVGPMTAANIALRDQVNLIVNMSQALAGLGIRDEQILQETRALITGNINANAAAAKILGITSADISAAKQQGQLYEFLSSKIAAFAEAGERGSNTLAILRSNFGDALEQRAAAATEKLTAALGRLFARLTDLVQSDGFTGLLTTIADRAAGIVDNLTSLVQWLGALGPNAQLAFTAMVGGGTKAAVAISAVLLPMVLLRGIITGLPMLINPVRMAFVALAGVSFLDSIRDLQLFSRELGIISTFNLASWGQLAAAGLGIGAAALAGWELGQFINELTVAGLKVGDWAAIVVVMVQDKIGGAFSALQRVWVRLRAAWDSFQLHVRATALELAIAVAEAWSRLPFSRKIDTTEWKLAVARIEAEIAGLDTKTDAALKAILDKRIAAMVEAAGLVEWIKQQGQSPNDKPAPEGEGAEPSGGGTTKRKIDEKQQLFALDTAIRAAEVRGDQAEVDRLTRMRDQLKLLKDLGQESLGLIIHRLDLEDALRDRERARQEQELEFARAIGDLQQRRAQTEANRFLTEEQKQRQIVELLREENRLIAARIAAAELELKRGATDERRSQLQQQIDQDRRQFGSNVGDIEENRPLSIIESAQAAVVSWMDSIGSRAKQVGDLLKNTIGTAVQGIGQGITGLLIGTATWADMLRNIGTNILGAVVQAIVNMFAQWIVGRAAAMAFGIKASATEGAADAAAKAPGAILTSISSFGVAAAVGLAAVVAALAAFATGGLVEGPGTGTSDSILARLSNGEFVNRAAAVNKFGRPFFEDLNAGFLNLAALPDNVAAGMTRPAYAPASGSGGFGGGGSPDMAALVDAVARKININLVNVAEERAATRVARRGAAADDVVAIVRSRRGEIFRNGPAR